MATVIWAQPGLWSSPPASRTIELPLVRLRLVVAGRRWARHDLQQIHRRRRVQLGLADERPRRSITGHAYSKDKAPEAATELTRS